MSQLREDREIFEGEHLHTVQYQRRVNDTDVHCSVVYGYVA